MTQTHSAGRRSQIRRKPYFKCRGIEKLEFRLALTTLSAVASSSQELDCRLSGMAEVSATLRGAGEPAVPPIRDVTVHLPPLMSATLKTNAADSPTAVAHGDLDGDGHAELIVANKESDDLTIYPGFGDGTFAKPSVVALQAGETPVDVVARDFNRDGWLDIATANADSGDLSILVNSNDGSFSQQQLVPLGDNLEPMSLVAEDLNGDGFIDLATANRSDDVSIAWGSSDGEFSAPDKIVLGLVVSTSSFAGISRLEVSDLNGDSHPDLVIARSALNVAAVLLNDGIGGLLAPSVFTVPNAPSIGWKVADVSGDGRPDLISGFVIPQEPTRETHVMVQKGNGDGTFDDTTTLSLGLAVTYVSDGDSVTVGDLDSNGWNDIVLGNGSLVLMNEGGMFRQMPGDAIGRQIALVADLDGDGVADAVSITDESPAPDRVITAIGNGGGLFSVDGGGQLARGDRPTAVAVGDLNLDGLRDLVAVNDDGLAVRLADSARAFRPIQHHRLGASRAKRAVAIGDVTDDGWPDVVTGGNADNISIFPGSAGGKLLTPLHLPVGDTADVRLHDVNRDNRLDIVVGRSAAAVSIFLADGNQSFLPRVDLTASESPKNVALADFNADGQIDIVATNYSENGGFSVLLGQGQNQWSDAHDYSVSGLRYPKYVHADDFDLDNNLDILVWNRDLGAALSRGNGDGTFREATVIGDTEGSGPIASGDINGDGTPDLVNTHGDQRFVLSNQGDGSFQLQEIGEFHQADDLIIEDVDLDGELDVVSVSAFANELAIQYGAGDGQLTDSLKLPTASGDVPVFVSVADVNHDGVHDILTRTHESASNDLAISIGRGNGSFREAVYVPISASPESEVEVIADVRGIGQNEILTADKSSGELTIRGSTDGVLKFAMPEAAEVQADLNDDGHLDVIALDRGSGRFRVMLGTGGGSFRDWSLDSITLGSWPRDVVSVDVNNDGSVDLVTGNRESGDLAVFLARRDGTFEPPQFVEIDEERLLSIAAGDFNQDGNVDVVVGVDFSHPLQLLLGNGDGTFSKDQPIGNCSNCFPERLSVADLNNDGRLDLVATEGSLSHSGSLTVIVWQGLPGGAFGRPVEYGHDSVFTRFIDHAIVDANRDGVLDIVTINDQTSEVAVFHGNGDTTLQDPIEFSAGDGEFLAALAVGDLNGDGFEDAVIANVWSDDLALFLTDAEGLLHSSQMFSLHADASPVDVAIDDLNGDGLNDILVATEGTGDLTLLRGGGDGTFGLPERFPIQIAPRYLTLYKQAGDRFPTVVVTDFRDDAVEVLQIGQPSEIRVDQGTVVVTSHGVELEAVPASELRTLTIIGTSQNDEIAVDLPSSTTGVIQIDAGSGPDTIRWPSDDGQAAVAGVLTSVETIDLRNSNADLLQIGELESDQDLHTIIDIGDYVGLESGWTLQTPLIRDGEFYRAIARDGLRLLIESNAPWQNPINRLDVNGNLTIGPIDVLNIVNALNAGRLIARLPNPTTVLHADYRYFDTSGDGFLTSADALQIINHLNRKDGEFEAEAQPSPYLSIFADLGAFNSLHQPEDRLPATPSLIPSLASIRVPLVPMATTERQRASFTIDGHGSFRESSSPDDSGDVLALLAEDRWRVWLAGRPARATDPAPERRESTVLLTPEE